MMQLTLYTDYSLRVLIYLGCKQDSATISEVAEKYQISKNHLVKVAHNLGRQGYIETTRGRSGGLRLAREPELINLGDVIRDMEPNFHLAECFNRQNGHCAITASCQLKTILREAYTAFFKVLESYTLADLLREPEAMIALLEGTGAAAAEEAPA